MNCDDEGKQPANSLTSCEWSKEREERYAPDCRSTRPISGSLIQEQCAPASMYVDSPPEEAEIIQRLLTMDFCHFEYSLYHLLYGIRTEFTKGEPDKKNLNEHQRPDEENLVEPPSIYCLLFNIHITTYVLLDHFITFLCLLPLRLEVGTNGTNSLLF